MIIEGKEISLVYDINMEEETYALRNVSITLNRNEMTAIIGPSGSGKSSLLYILSGLKKATSGTVYYDDIDIESLSVFEKDTLRKEKFGFIFQRHFLIDYLTILDNVLVGLNKYDKASIDKALSLLDRLKISHLAKKRPYQLSGGQRQRTAVARALINDPSVIFADEPTASLDHRNALEVMSVLEEFRDRASILVVTHDVSILGNVDRTVEIWDGFIKL
jgi:putative ABC transport system ATP-binding protein